MILPHRVSPIDGRSWPGDQWSCAVVIPVRNEQERIGPCLAALGNQVRPAPVLLLLNNTTDGTMAAVRDIAPALPMPVFVRSHDFPPQTSDAGHARQMAMALAAGRLAPNGVLLCTDADGQVAPDWLAANLRHIATGADAVAGRATIDPADAALIPAALHEADARECAYAAALDEIDSLLDPHPHDPWPRHTEHSGASIAVTGAAYRASGGIPPVPVGEDRAFFAALRRAGARVRHAPDVLVVVSGRIQGRAAGGMADTIRRRMVAPDPFLDDALEPALARVRRARLRARFRAGFAACPEAALDGIGVSLAQADRLAVLAETNAAAAWQAIEARSPDLARELVAVAALPHEMAQALGVLHRLHAAAEPAPTEALPAF